MADEKEKTINEEMLWIWMTKLGKPMAKAIELVFEKYGSPENAWNAEKPDDKIIKKSGTPVFYERLFDEKIRKTAQEEYERAADAGVRVITKKSRLYPKNLLEIYNSPPVLYTIGRLPSEVKEDMTLVSVVGSRACTSYGRTTTYRLCRELAYCGIGIVSGLARGIDVSAHLGALDVGGYTIAVLGGGPDVIYPPEHKKVYERIAETGCIISEHPVGTEPLRNFFPARNRIIAGLSSATFVTEAGKSSGAMITVDRALEEGRDVFALPGNIDSPSSDGTNGLIKKGAACITCSADIIEALTYCGTGFFSDSGDYIQDNISADFMSENEKKVYKMIKDGSGRPENGSCENGLDQKDISVALTRLELKGIIKKEQSGVWSVKKFFTT